MNIRHRESELEKFKAQLVNQMGVQFPQGFWNTPMGFLCEDMFRTGFALGMASSLELLSINLNNMAVDDQNQAKKEKSRIILPN